MQDTIRAAPVDGFAAAKAIRAKGLETPKAPASLHYSAPSDDGSVQERDQVNSPAVDGGNRASRRASGSRGGSKKNKSRRR